MSYSNQRPDHKSPRWAVRFESEQRQNTGRRYTRGQRFRGLRIFMMSTFLMHLMVYFVIMAMLFFINLLTWDGMLWMVFPAVGWGALVSMHGGFAWLTANIGVSDRMVDRAQGNPVPRVSTHGFGKKRNAKPSTPEAELQMIVADGLDKVDEMRVIGRNMRTPSARRNATHAVSAIENTLLALEGQTDELPLAREFASAFIEPSYRIFVEYDRLSSRDIQSAQSILHEVEQNDLPRITERAEQVHERVHRGTMIDLQVAREMLNLGSGD